MRFAKRLVKCLTIMKDGEVNYQWVASDTLLVTVFAHEDDESNSQLLGIEAVNKVTGEVDTVRINLPTTEMYGIFVTEILEVQE